MGQGLKNPPAMQDTHFQSLGQEDPLEEGVTEEPRRLQSIELQRVGHY